MDDEESCIKDTKSEFIKDKIRETHGKNRGDIDDLIKIERFALGKFGGFNSGYIARDLKTRSPKEHNDFW